MCKIPKLPLYLRKISAVISLLSLDWNLLSQPKSPLDLRSFSVSTFCHFFSFTLSPSRFDSLQFLLRRKRLPPSDLYTVARKKPPPSVSACKKIVNAMDLSPFRLDIDELINEYAEGGFTSFADMKKVWIGRKFTYIFEAAPSSNLAFFMQSMYAQSIGHVVSTASLSHRLGGLYCLYSLYETQPFKPPYKIYLSIGELKKLKELVVDAKEKKGTVASAVVKRMLEKNMFLFGSVDMNESSALETVNQLTELQNARIQVAYNKLFADTPIEDYIHMDMGMESGLNVLKKMSTNYSEAKKVALFGKSSGLNTFGLMWCNGVICGPLLLFWISIRGDIETTLNFRYLFSFGFQAVMLLSCIMAFLINYFVFLNTTLNSALTQTVCGNFKTIGR